MHKLLVILDREIIGGRDIAKIALEVMRGGARFIQLRDKISSDRIILKEARILRKITRDHNCTLIINDRPDITLAASCDGLHLGQDDIAYHDARALLGKEKIIGISTHNIEQARTAQIEGADYIGVGPIFATPTKPALGAIGLGIVSEISREIGIPAFFIGGITLATINEIIEKGAGFVAVANGILKSGDILETTRAFVNILESEKLKAQSAKPKLKTQNVLNF